MFIFNNVMYQDYSEVLISMMCIFYNFVRLHSSILQQKKSPPLQKHCAIYKTIETLHIQKHYKGRLTVLTIKEKAVEFIMS